MATRGSKKKNVSVEGEGELTPSTPEIHTDLASDEQDEITEDQGVKYLVNQQKRNGLLS